MSSPRLVRVAPAVVDTDLDDGEIALLHLETKTYFTLNRTAGRIWQLLKEGLSPTEVSRRLQEEFKVDPVRADTSVGRLVDELLRNDLARES
jgi:hypothetical protein